MPVDPSTSESARLINPGLETTSRDEILIRPLPSRHCDIHLQANPVDRCQDHQLFFVWAFHHETPQIDGQFRVAAPQRAVPFLSFGALLAPTSHWCYGYIDSENLFVSIPTCIHNREPCFVDHIFLCVELNLQTLELRLCLLWQVCKRMRFLVCCT